MRGSGGGMKPGFTPTGGASAMAGRGGKADFVICEICDGYIKDLEQLRNHMLWIHKVRKHNAFIFSIRGHSQMTSAERGREGGTQILTQ